MAAVFGETPRDTVALRKMRTPDPSRTICRAAERAVMNCDATILVTGHELLDGEVHGACCIAVLGRLRAHGIEYDVDSACRADYLVDMAIDGVFVEGVQLGSSGRLAIRRDRVSHRLHPRLCSTREEQAAPCAANSFATAAPTSPPAPRMTAIKLEAAGLLQKRRLPPPAASTVYELTGAGRALEEVVLAMGRWATLFGRRVAAEDATRPEWQLYALKGAFRAEAAARVNRTFEMHFGEQVIAAEVGRGRLTLSEGPAVAPDMVVKTEFRTFMELVAGRLALTDARKRGLIALKGGGSGDPELLFELFSVRITEVPVDLMNQTI